MAETGDLLHEFKSAKPPEKAVIVMAVLAVGGIGIYLYMKNKGASTSATSTGDPNNTTQTSGYPTANGVPILPPGVTGQYDPNGNLIGYSSGPAAPGPAGPAGPPGKPGSSGGAGLPSNWFSTVLGKVGYGATINKGGFNAQGFQRFWIGTGKSAKAFYAPAGSQINRGAEGRIWLQLPGATSGQLLTGPGMAKSKTTVAKTAAKKAA
jgi:hypothetical protein